MIDPQIIIAASFGVAFVIGSIVLAIFFPRPTGFQQQVFRIVLSLAAAGVAAMFPGFIDLDLHASKVALIRAGGALAVFVIVYFFNPARGASSGGLSPAEQAIVSRHVDLISGRIPRVRKNYLERALSIENDRLRALYNVLLS
ncbi:MAG TPA: hypothetical protein VHR66_31580 [Gemmataceae bacterium]|jgi:hypothetical protein|nr:hypothetical protein [Gemmataceae bacterium]